jgi:hypothetical protein
MRNDDATGLTSLRPVSGKRLRYPDFIGIGAQKAGTTWLHKMLLQHQDVWLPPVKELHYFNMLHLNGGQRSVSPPAAFEQRLANTTLRSVKRALKSQLAMPEQLKLIYSLSLIGIHEMTDEWYGRIFQAAPEESICGEITPEYAILPDEGIEHIFRLQPRTKIIFILRDPIDRGWSQLKMMQKRATIADAQNSERTLKKRDFFARADYMNTIERFRKHVKEEDFLVLYFDDIAERPQEVLSSVCEFLGVNFAPEKFEGLNEATNQGLPATMEPELYNKIRERLEPVYQRLLVLDNPIVKKWYHKHYG